MFKSAFVEGHDINLWKEFYKLLFNNFYWAFDCKQSLSKYLNDKKKE